MSGIKKDVKGKPTSKGRPSNEDNQPMLTVRPPEEVVKKNTDTVEEGFVNHNASLHWLLKL